MNHDTPQSTSYAAVPHSIFHPGTRRQLTLLDYAVYAQLVLRGHDQRRECRVSAGHARCRATLAQWAGRSVAGIYPAIPRLTGAGLVDDTRDGRTGVYHLPLSGRYFRLPRWAGLPTLLSTGSRTLALTVLALCAIGAAGLVPAPAALARVCALTGLDRDSVRRDLRWLCAHGWGRKILHGFQVGPQPALLKTTSPALLKTTSRPPPEPIENHRPQIIGNSTKKEQRDSTKILLTVAPGAPVSPCSPVLHSVSSDMPDQQKEVAAMPALATVSAPLPTHEAHVLVSWALGMLGSRCTQPTSTIGRQAIRRLYARLRDGYTVDDLRGAITVATQHAGQWPGYRNICVVWGVTWCDALVSQFRNPTPAPVAQHGAMVEALLPYGLDAAQNKVWQEQLLAHSLAVNQQLDAQVLAAHAAKTH